MEHLRSAAIGDVDTNKMELIAWKIWNQINTEQITEYFLVVQRSEVTVHYIDITCKIKS